MTKKTANHHTVPFSLRLTPEERRLLERDAAGIPMAEYARTKLFSQSNAASRIGANRPTKARNDIAQVLALLGKSGLVHAYASLADEIRSGHLEISEETEAQLQSACSAILDMRTSLLRALGLRPGER